MPKRGTQVETKQRQTKRRKQGLCARYLHFELLYKSSFFYWWCFIHFKNDFWLFEYSSGPSGSGLSPKQWLFAFHESHRKRGTRQHLACRPCGICLRLVEITTPRKSFLPRQENRFSRWVPCVPVSSVCLQALRVHMGDKGRLQWSKMAAKRFLSDGDEGNWR